MDVSKTLQAVEVPLPGGPLTLEFTWEDFSLSDTMGLIERAFIEKALETCGGRITAAARSLGITHQGLAYIIQHRHSDLLSKREPIRPRRKPDITKNSKHKSMQRGVSA